MVEMKPGPELDAAVAERVMGQEFRDGPRTGERVTSTTVMPYSTDIVFAWQVVERLVIANDGYIKLEYLDNVDGDTWWECSLCTEKPGWGEGSGETAPHAISLAALAAMEEVR